MENLAPAGNREALERADAAGADAVYLGYSAFSARAGAGNFNREELAEAIRFAHLRHMRVHVTVNTLVKDGELAEVARVLLLLRELRADAVLVQDLGVLRLCRSLAPDLTVHASTQMTIHNRTGVRWCARRGIRRVVLARECSLEEIRRCKGAGAEIEVFGHGAQCVSVSGQCLFSSMVGQRSGNRGRCAQPCRKRYEYRGAEGAWLSPRDLCLLEDLRLLEEAGVSSVKLEGRLKRPEYVAVTTGACRRGLDALETGRPAAADSGERKALRQIFSRGDFMKGYALGCEDAAVIDPAASGHLGLSLGKVESVSGRLARVRLTEALLDGDAVAVGRGEKRAEMIYAGKDALPGETVTLRLREGTHAAPGDPVRRLTDGKQLREAMALPGRRVPVSLNLAAFPGRPLELEASDGISRVRVAGETVSPARTSPASEASLARALKKTGDTVFIPGEVRAETAGAFVPVGEVNALRREALSRLAEERIRAFEPARTGPAGPFPPAELPARPLPPLAWVRTGEQAEAARAAGWRVIRDPEDFRAEALARLFEEMAPGDWLQLPVVCEEATLEALFGLCAAARGKLGGVVLGSVGQLGRDWPLPFAAGPGLPVMNRQAAALLLEEGCVFVTASEELTGAELKTLTAGGAPIAVKIWGRAQLMLLHHCPARTALGLKTGHRDCDWCDRGAPEALRGSLLRDPRGYAYPLLRQRLPEGCLVRLMNERPTEWTDRAGGFFPAAVLTTESREAAERVFAAAAASRKTGMEATAGHWQRPVE